jgi:hypothetical protein
MYTNGKDGGECNIWLISFGLVGKRNFSLHCKNATSGTGHVATYK